MQRFKKSKFNKVAGMLLAVAFLFTGSFGASLVQQPAVALVDDPIELTAGTVTGNPGDTVEVPITLTSSGKVAGGQYDLSIDLSLLTYKQTVAGDDISTSFRMLSNQLESGDIRVMHLRLARANRIPAGTVVIAVMQFEVAAGASPGAACALELTGVKYHDGDRIVLPVTANNGQFSVPAEAIGVTGVILNKTTDTIIPSLSDQLTVAITPANATNQDVTWESDNEAVATVSSTGLVTAVAPGTANIIITTDDGGYTATCEVTVPDTSIDGWVSSFDGLTEAISNAPSGSTYTIALLNNCETDRFEIIGLPQNCSILVVNGTTELITIDGFKCNASSGSLEFGPNINFIDGIETELPFDLIINGDVTGSSSRYVGFGIDAERGSRVTVNGNVYGNDGVNIGYGDIGIYVDYATVTVNGDVYGGNANNVQGGVGVCCWGGGAVTVYGNVNGGNGIGVPGGAAISGSGITVYGTVTDGTNIGS
jgi:hypothetical protein